MWVSTLLLACLACRSAQYGLPGSPDIRTPPAAFPPPPPPPPFVPPVCPAVGTRTFPDERLCEAYFLCTGGERVHMLCPLGEVYNNLDAYIPGRPRATCVSAANVTCTLSYPYDVPHQTPLCPAHGLHHYPDDRICDGYYQCNDGEGEHLLCPAGQLFSPAGPATPCADAADVHCPSLLPPPVVWDVPECGGLGWKHLPDPDDCSSFFECRGGQAYRRSCPKDLLYNARSPATRYPCDYPFNAQCGAPHAPPVPPPWGNLGPVPPPWGPSGPVPPPRRPSGPVPPPRGPSGPVPPPRAPSGPVPPPNDSQPDDSSKVFNFYTYVTHNW